MAKTKHIGESRMDVIGQNGNDGLVYEGLPISDAICKAVEDSVMYGSGAVKVEHVPADAMRKLNTNDVEIEMEETPDGIDQHEAGAKLDAGKNRLGLVLGGFPNALMAVGEVGTFGANKYTDNGWKFVDRGFERYTDAMMRHQMKEFAGEDSDPDSEMLHAAHTAWNALARLELMLRDAEVRS